MLCATCGTDLPRQAVFCWNCGNAQLTGLNADALETSEPDAQFALYTPPPSAIQPAQGGDTEDLDGDVSVSLDELTDALSDVLLQLSEGLRGPQRSSAKM